MKQLIVCGIFLVGLVGTLASAENIYQQLKRAYRGLPNASVQSTFDGMKSYFDEIDSNKLIVSPNPFPGPMYIANIIKGYMEEYESLPTDWRRIAKNDRKWKDLASKKLEHIKVISKIYQSALGGNINDDEAWPKLDRDARSDILTARFAKLLTDRSGDNFEAILHETIID